MSADLVILVPVLRRPHRVGPLLQSIEAATPEARVVFLSDSEDHAEQRAVRIARADHRLNVDLLKVDGNYARKINRGVEITDEPYIFAGADDLTFQPGWLKAARAHLGDAQVVGVNDLIDRRPTRQGHATHFLFTRKAAELPTIDGEPGPFFLGYAHNFCDDELIATATRRGMYAYAEDAHVRHEHPMSGGDDDEVYQLGRAPFKADRRRFFHRSHLWT